MKIKSFLLSVVVGFIIGGVTLAEASTVYENPVAKHNTYQIQYKYDNANSDRGKVHSQFTYNDGYFLQDSTKLNGEVAKMSVALAAAAYDPITIGDIFEDMHFTIVNPIAMSKSYDDGRLSINDNDHVAYTIGRKVIDGYTVYCVPIRGTGPNAEWYSDFNLGEGDDHEGFYLAADEVYDDLIEQINTDGASLSKTVVLLTGHSRGAAVTNIIAARLDKSTSIPDKQIFGYAFACPAVSRNADQSLKNIYNINNPGDLITLLPMEDWGYKRNGVDIYVYSGALPTQDNVYYQFKRLSGLDCRSEDDPSAYLSLLRTLVPDKDTFMSSQFQVLFRFVAFALGGKNNSSLWDVISYNNFEAVVILCTTIATIKSDFESGAAANNVYSLFCKYNVSLAKEYDELYESCCSWLKESDDDLSYDSIRSSRTGRRIKELVQIEIHNRSDIVLAKAKFSDLLSLIDCYSVDNMKLITLFFSESGTIMDSITHGHVQFFYVSLVNSLFCGYRGWYEYNGEVFELNKNASFDSNAYDSVMDIGEECFRNCRKIINVQLPKELNSISKAAFYWCDGLYGEVEIPSGVRTIGEEAFYYCANISGKLEIPDGVSIIEKNTFAGCESVEEVVIPESVLAIEDGAFAVFCGLKRLTIPCYTTFESGYDVFAFSGCEKLEYVSITGFGPTWDFEDYFTNLHSYRYTPWRLSKVDSLEVSIAEGVTRIGNYCFCGCSNMKEINIPSTVTEIGDYAYCNCNASSAVEGCKLVIPSGVTSIGDHAFEYCKQATGDLNLPKGLTYLGEYAFRDCENLTGAVVIPEGITEIPTFAFSECRKINKLTIHDGVTSVGDYAFAYCDSLRDLIIPGTSFVLENDTVFKLDKYSSGGVNHVRITGQGEMIIAKPTYWGTDIGNVSINHAGNTPWYLSKAESIEVEIDEGITNIQDYAFASTKVTNIDIPNTVTSIGTGAYYGCKANQKLVIPNKVTSIGAGAFGYCTNLTGLEIPASVKNIGEYAFFECEKIAGKIDVPNGITTIKKGTFSGCENVEDVVIPESVLAIEDGAFAVFCGLKRLTIPCYTTFESGYDVFAFSGCEKLEYVSITGFGPTWDFEDYFTNLHSYRYTPWRLSKVDSLEVSIAEGVTRIGNYCFCGCSNMKEINIPSTVTEIGDYAYCNCNASSAVEGCKLVIPSGVTSIGDHAFEYCKQATGDLNLPKGLTYLGEYAFRDCENLTGAVVIPEGITEIPTFAFSECRKINKLTIHDGVTSVGDYAFAYCDSLRDLIIPGTSFVLENDTVFKLDKYSSGGVNHVRITGQGEMIIAKPTYWGTDIGNVSINHAGNTPWYLSKAESIEVEIDEGITNIQDYAFASTKVTNIDIPNTVTSIGTGAYYGCKANQKLVIPNKVTSIGAGAFGYCTNLTGLEIPASVKNIGEYAFFECEKIAGKIDVPNGITTIKKGTFSGCENVEDVVIPESVLAIEDGAFAVFCGLKRLTIPCYTTFESGYDVFAFSGCEKLEYVSITGFGPTWDFEDYFTNLHSYRYTPWRLSKVDSLEVSIAEGVTRIGNYCFCGCLNMKEINIPSTVTEIGDYAYCNCNASSAVEGCKLVIPSGVTSIGDHAFEYCKQATGDLNLPKGLTYLGEYAFRDCENLTGAVVIPEGITEIKDATFSCCYCLESLSIPSGVKKLGNLAFAYCSNVENITMPCDVKYVTTGDNRTFKSCPAIDHASIIGHIEVTDEAVAPDCTNTGLTEGSHCSLCGKVFVAQEEVPALGHTPVADEAVAPDCTHTGLTEGSHCSTCGEVILAQEDIPATGHTPVIDPAVEPDSTHSGLTEGSHCSVCGEVIVAQEVIPALDHVHTPVTDEAVAPDCTHTGLTEGSHCSVCNEVLVAQETVPALGHKPVTDDAVAPDCTHTGLTEGSHCSVCNEVIVAQEVVPAKGHTPVTDPAVEPTHTETGLTEGSHCSVCGEILVAQEVVPVLTPEKIGWIEEDGAKYYYNVDGVKMTGWQKIDGSWYYLDPSTGAMLTGWQKSGSSWYYMDPNTGIMKTGWVSISGKWYYMNSSGVMQTGWQKISGIWYYFESSGAMATGWKQLSGKWYYFDRSGTMASGWKQISGTWYYFESSGAMVSGWKQIGGTWYYFESSGAMAKNWKQIGGSWYYFGSSGAMVTGWKQISGKWYYFYDSGKMATNTTIDGYKIGKDGVMV
ncbi:leucine-rich repeat protein [Butyrivibrio sp. AE2032]|uniref:leucine-rich repeat protein n=1 Tax=Butyrivibrio sp. AE2032 TaxID=1458463 RepID=UPI0005592912|nr:leucine-rich repeat protein [Butyrivibrio sp. AE2032]